MTAATAAMGTKMEAEAEMERLDSSPVKEVNISTTITVHHRGVPHKYTFPQKATLSDLSQRVAHELSIPIMNQKYLISPQMGVFKPPFSSEPCSSAASSSSLSSSLSSSSSLKQPPTVGDLTTKKIVLLGSTVSEVSSVQSPAPPQAQQHWRTIRPAKAYTRPVKQGEGGSIYTFSTLRPLPYLPQPERSLAYLARLRDDPGIQAVMRSHRWTVPLLTEMDPIQHTTYNSRTLGLNRNRGEVIELRLRTDVYDGYRDYRTIRNTLCHELAHNVHDEHDADFWSLCRQVETEVLKNDWRGNHSGRPLTRQEFYTPMIDDHGHVDDAGWIGGEYVLGRTSSAAAAAAAAVPESVTVHSERTGTTNLSRREILARAAEERSRNQQHHHPS